MPADDEKRSIDGLESFAGSKDAPYDLLLGGLRTSSRKRSSLFDALPNTRSRNEYTNNITLNLEHSQSTIVLNESQMMSNADSIRPTSPAIVVKGQKPLFGAVMKGSETCEPAVGRILGSQNITGTNSSNVENSNLLDETDSTGSVMSPTGKTIMGFVNNFGNSPFRFQSPQKRSLVQSKSVDPTIVSHSRLCTSGRHKRDCPSQSDRYSKTEQDWLQIPVIGDNLPCLDYSLCTTVLVECNLNLGLRSVMAQDNAQKHLVYWIYPLASPNSISKSVSTSLVNNKKSAGSWVRSSTEETSAVPSDLGERLISFVKGDKALFSRKKVGKIQRRENSSISMYWWRWQEAIRSIFLKWCGSITTLLDGNENGMVASDIYFYCLAKDHVAMFRVDEISNSNSNVKYEPRVILSNITTEFRMKLEHKGMEDFQYLHDPTLDATDGCSPEDNVSSAPMSPNVKAELEALRRAQALGENAGADVRVKSDVRRIKKPTADHVETPCSIFGFDNVSCFFEVYLNSFGQMQTLQAQDQRLPLLVCDTIGPFLHATLETLKSRPMRTMGTDSVCLEGLILPGAFRSVVAIITREVVKRGNNPQRHSNTVEGKEGDCYMLIETSLNEELSPVARKLEDTRAFNGWNVIKNNQSGENKMVECAKGRCIRRLVWEASSPEVLACNFE